MMVFFVFLGFFLLTPFQKVFSTSPEIGTEGSVVSVQNSLSSPVLASTNVPANAVLPVVQTSKLIDKENSFVSDSGLKKEPIVSVSDTAKEFSNNKQKENLEGIHGVKDIYLNFENSSLASFVNYMADLKKINLIPDKTLDASKVSLTVRDPLSVDGAWNIFLTVLEMAGFSIIEVGGVYRIVSKDKKLTEPLPAYVNTKAEDLPNSDVVIRYVVFLQNIQVASVEELLKTMLSDKNSVYSHKEANGFVITDKAYNVKSAVKIIEHLDQIGQPETVVVMRLKKSNAVDVQQLLESLIKKPEGNPLAQLLGKQAEGTTDYFPRGTRIIAEARTNSLILMGTPGPIKKIEDFIVNHVDTDLKEAESPLHIYELQYTDAQQMVDILKEVTASPDQGPGQDAAKFGAIRGGVKYFKSMKFQAEKEGNRLLVSCTDKNDWKLLKRTIQDLDKPQPQVALETLIVTISAKNDDLLAGMLRNKKHELIGKGIDFQSVPVNGTTQLEYDSSGTAISLLGNILQQIITGQGSAILSFGSQTNIWSIFEMLKTCSNTTVLAQPFITVANKTQATISAGTTQQVVTATSGTSSGYTPINASTQIDITPQINLDGVMRLQINIGQSSFIAPASEGNKNNNSITTNVTVADGQILILGGFVQTSIKETKNKTPLLADIPVFGWLFKNHQVVTEKSYEFFFIAPTIIKPRTLPGVELYTKMKLHAAADSINDGADPNESSEPIMNWFFDSKKENYSHKIVDFANARYQPTTVDIKHDLYYRSNINQEHSDDALSSNVSSKMLIKEELYPIEKNQQDTVLATLDNEQFGDEIVKKRQSLKSFIHNEDIGVLDKKLDEKRLKLKSLLNNAALSNNSKKDTSSIIIEQKNLDKSMGDNQKIAASSVGAVL